MTSSAALALVEEVPRELLADHADVELLRRGVGALDVLEDDVGVGAEADEQDRGDRRPDDLDARVPVDRRPVQQLLARLHAVLPDGEEDDRLDEHEDRDGGDQQDVPQRVDVLGLAWKPPPGTSRSTGRARCRAPTRPSRSRNICRSCARLSRDPRGSSAAISSPPANPWRRHPMADERRTVRQPAMPRAVPERGAYAACGRPWCGRAAGPEVRRGDAEMAPERLRELRRLAVAHAVRDLADGQPAGREQLRGLVHAHARQVIAERRPADLGVRALELAARGRHAPGDLVEREVAAVLAVDDLGRLLEEARAELDRCRSLRRHVHTYLRERFPNRMSRQALPRQSGAYALS